MSNAETKTNAAIRMVRCYSLSIDFGNIPKLPCVVSAADFV